MKKHNLFFVLALCLFILVGCPVNDNSSQQSNQQEQQSFDYQQLDGSWVSSWGEIYKIKTGSNSYLKNYYTDQSGDVHETYTCSDLTFVIGSDKKSGYIYCKYTKSAMPDWSYSEQGADVGKWWALYFTGLTTNTMVISGAAKTGGASSKATLEEAEQEFTVANGYFAYTSDVTVDSRSTSSPVIFYKIQ